MRKFTLKALLFLSPLLLPVLYYLLLIIRMEQSGDLGRMAHIFFEKGYHDRLNHPEKKHNNMIRDIAYNDIPDNPSIICFGDSFSDPDFGYSRWLMAAGEILNDSIYNINFHSLFDPINDVFAFLTHSPDCKLPSTIIMECVERQCVPLLAEMDYDNPPSESFLFRKLPNDIKTHKTFLNNVIEFYKYRLGYRVPVITSELSSPLFTNKYNQSKLYSYWEDTIHYEDSCLYLAVSNLNRLYDLAEKRGVVLSFFIIPNKSSVYLPYIYNRNEKEIFYSALYGQSAFDTIPYAFNPLNMLFELTSNKEKDIYYADDSHWTPKTANIVGSAYADFLINSYSHNCK